MPTPLRPVSPLGHAFRPEPVNRQHQHHQQQQHQPSPEHQHQQSQQGSSLMGVPLSAWEPAPTGLTAVQQDRPSAANSELNDLSQVDCFDW